MSGRSVLVTGASSGLGLATARALAALGARVGLTARDLGRLERALHSLPGEGHYMVPFDIAQTDGIAPAMREWSAKHGRLHGVVHAAGVMQLRPLRMVGATEWETSMRVNVAAAAGVARGYRQPAVNADGGSVVFLASVAGLVGHAGQSVYGATKGALMALTRSLAVELAPEKIRVNCVAPAVVETGMSEQLRAGMTAEQWAQVVARHPLGLGQPDDVAHAVAFLLAATGRWITGTTLVVDGGYTAH